MKKLVYIILISVTIIDVVNGQTSYIATDSTKISGVKLIKGCYKVNSRICRLEKGDSIITYSPYEIKEYQLKDGPLFVSKEIKVADSLQRVFLKCLSQGKAAVYYYRNKGHKTFFLEMDKTLFVEIPKYNTDDKSFKEQLSDLTSDCSNIRNASKFVKYNKKSLAKFITRYNRCNSGPFPHFRFGFNLGYEFTKLKPPSEETDNTDLNYIYVHETTNDIIQDFHYKYDGGFSLGIFMDNPIALSNFSLHTELYYSKHRYAYNYFVTQASLNQTYRDLTVNINSLKVPILIRYTLASNKIRPFINLGGSITFNIRNENSLYETSIFRNILELRDLRKYSLVDKKMAGYNIGGGIEYNFSIRNSLFFELRLNNQYGLTDSETYKFSEIRFITGINI